MHAVAKEDNQISNNSFAEPSIISSIIESNSGVYSVLPNRRVAGLNQTYLWTCISGCQAICRHVSADVAQRRAFSCLFGLPLGTTSLQPNDWRLVFTSDSLFVGFCSKCYCERHAPGESVACMQCSVHNGLPVWLAIIHDRELHDGKLQAVRGLPCSSLLTAAIP